MSRRKTILFTATVATGFLVACGGGGSGGHSDGGHPSMCPSVVIGSWSENVTAYQSSTSLFVPFPPTAFNVGFTACVNDGNDRTIQFVNVPVYPPAVGTYPLKWNPYPGHPGNGYAGAEFVTTRDGSYFTNDTGPASTGSFVITQASATTMSGTFSFHGIDNTGTTSVDITSGTFTNIRIQ